MLNKLCIAVVALSAFTSFALPATAADPVKAAAGAAARPVMAKDGIPGMAVGVTIGGRHYVFDYGVAARDTGTPVTDATLFEIGSISKTLTATLAGWAETEGRLSLADRVDKYLPALQGTPFGAVSLLTLGTHTPGGLPVQVPDGIADLDQLMQYFHDWQPSYPSGTYRTYTNPGIGLLGLITARAMGEDFTALMQGRLFPALGLTETYLDVPAAKVADYAQGYTRQDEPIRMTGGVLAAEAYGVRTTAGDLLRFLDANMGLTAPAPGLARAIVSTHTGYFRAGVLTQDLMWEQYAWPVKLETLLEGNAQRMLNTAMPATRLTPPMAPREDVWINKTGSTNGFGAYVAFVPQQRLGVVILANKSWPNEDRVAMAYQIMEQVAGQ
jgi:beta-lactamase class C